MATLLRGTAIVAAIALLGGCATPLQTTAVTDPPAQPLLALKMPTVFGPHLPGADVPVPTHAGPTPGTYEALALVRSPGSFVQFEGSTQEPRLASNTCNSGSFAAVMSVRLPPSARPGPGDLYDDCVTKAPALLIGTARN